MKTYQSQPDEERAARSGFDWRFALDPHIRTSRFGIFSSAARLKGHFVASGRFPYPLKFLKNHLL